MEVMGICWMYLFLYHVNGSLPPVQTKKKLTELYVSVSIADNKF